MKTIRLTGIAILLVALAGLVLGSACSGAEGATGPAGAAGPQGPKGDTGSFGWSDTEDSTRTVMVTSSSSYIDGVVAINASPGDLVTFTFTVSGGPVDYYVFEGAPYYNLIVIGSGSLSGDNTLSGGGSFIATTASYQIDYDLEQSSGSATVVTNITVHTNA